MELSHSLSLCKCLDGFPIRGRRKFKNNTIGHEVSDVNVQKCFLFSNSDRLKGRKQIEWKIFNVCQLLYNLISLIHKNFHNERLTLTMCSCRVVQDLAFPYIFTHKILFEIDIHKKKWVCFRRMHTYNRQFDIFQTFSLLIKYSRKSVRK